MTTFSFTGLTRLFKTASRLGQVDESFYYGNYPDVAGSGIDAAVHYREHGWREGRNPSAIFHTAYYAIRNLPGGQLSENPLAHFVAHGESPNLKTSPVNASEWASIQQELVGTYFDEKYYRQTYGDQIGDLTPIDHYFSVGWRVGCNPSRAFHTNSYLEEHAFILHSDINPLCHYALISARRSGKPGAEASVTADPSNFVAQADILRAIVPYFDPEYYEKENKDVAKRRLNPLEHYVEYGWREGRNPSAIFDTAFYRSRYKQEIGKDVNPLYHYATIGVSRGYQPNPIGTERWPAARAPADDQWSHASPAVDEDFDVNVIIPVYRGYDETLATIFSVLTAPQKTRFRLTVINDCSPDPALTESLRDLARRGLFAYDDNPTNLGFIGTINKGLSLHPDRDVVLLNSDTLVFGNWIDRLAAHVERDKTIATVTPYSNNATICSYPDPNRDNNLALECSREQLDRYASVCNKGRSTEVPTGVGFCLYIRRSVIDRIGPLDVAFGRGYGEESDFCVRALKAGYKNVIAEDVFVYHSGGVSFAEFFDEEYDSSQKLLASKHPDYPRRIGAFVRSDPGARSRARLDLYRVARSLGDSTALFIGMNGAGGIATHTQDLAQRLQDADVNVLLANISGDSIVIQPHSRARVIYTPALKPIDLAFDSELFAEFVTWLRPSVIHLHSLAMASWPAARALIKVLVRFGNRLFVTMHDYDPLCYRHNLVDDEGRYCEDRDRARCEACVRGSASPNRYDPSARLADWRILLAAARRVFVPSADTRRRLAQTIPPIDFVVREHEEQLGDAAPLRRPTADRPLRLVTIGAIGPHKGSNVIHALATDARMRNLPIEYHVVGYTDHDAEMKNVGVLVTGRYLSLDEALDEIRAIAPAFALLPSIWPETYCYTLSMALALGLPPIVFDLGAQADRVREAGFGVVLDPKLQMTPQAINDALLALSIDAEWAKVRPVRFARYGDILGDYYGVGARPPSAVAAQ